MAKPKFRYNPLTLSFERIDDPISKRLAKVAIQFGLSLLVAVFFIGTYSAFFSTPKVKILLRNNSDIVLNYELLEKRIQEACASIDIIQRRDNHIYRAIFEADTIPATVRLGGFGGSNHYRRFEGLTPKAALVRTATLLDLFTWKVYIQSKSFDEVIVLAKNKELLVQSIPAIQPISVMNLQTVTDDFGYRRDPFTRDIKMHTGIDFVGPVGIAIYATGNGEVIESEYSFFGYGNVVLIDHGFGYKTRYAHLHRISIELGQKVVRGQQIGTLGNSGRSTGPHLHYEVLHKNNPVDPVNYFNDMLPHEYDQMVSNSTKTAIR